MDEVRNNLVATAGLLREFAEERAKSVETAATALIKCLRDGGKILICGNGGSASQASHFAAELTGRFEKERKPLAAIALTTDTAALTAIGNDYGFEEVFVKQLRALAKKGDALVALSTSGKSANVVKAMKAAREMGVVTIGVTGKGGGDMVKLSDVHIDVLGDRTYMIQEVHLAIIHQLCRVIENAFSDGASA